jgi:hypothetical protein
VTSNPVITWIWSVDARIWQAVIAGAFVSAGWVFNGWQNRRDAARLRAERLRDVHRALYAEIGSTMANLGSPAALEQNAEGIMQRMSDDAGFVPFIPHEPGDHLYDAVVAEIHILPRCTIDPVVAFYSQIKAISALIEDMRGNTFKVMGQTRRMGMYRDYIAMKQQLFEYGLFATSMIKAYADGGADAAETLARKINSRAVAPSAPSPESE